MDDRRVLNNMTPGSARAGLGDRILKLEEQAAEAKHASAVSVAADAENGIDAGDLQTVLSALAARVKALEDAAQ